MAAIDSGSECERWAPVLSAIADGEASAQQIAEVRPHLRNCAGCRATLRDFQLAPREVAALVPAGVLALAEADGGSLVGRLYELLTGGLSERLLLSAQKVQGFVEAGSTAKVAAVAASATALAGGVAVQRAAEPTRPAPKAAAHLRDPARAGAGAGSLAAALEAVTSGSTMPQAASSPRSALGPPGARFTQARGQAHHGAGRRVQHGKAGGAAGERHAGATIG